MQLTFSDLDYIRNFYIEKQINLLKKLKKIDKFENIDELELFEKIELITSLYKCEIEAKKLLKQLRINSLQADIDSYENYGLNKKLTKSKDLN